MNVLLLTNLFPTPADPTRGVFTAQLARELGARCRLSVVCPLPWFPRWLDVPPFRKWGKFSRVPYHYWVDGRLVCSPKYPMLPKVSEALHADLMAPAAWRAVRRAHLRAPLQVIHAKWLYPDGVAAVRVGRRLGVPVVLTASGCDVNLFLEQREKRARILAAVRDAAAVTAVSRKLKDRLAAAGVPPERVAVIPNGVDAELFHLRDKAACRRDLGLPPEGRWVLFVGQLLDVKGVRDLVAAAASLPPDVKLCLVGEGPLRGALARDARRSGLGERLRFAGVQPHARVAVWVGAADVLCLPSVREGWPNVVMEALACGRPVVGTRVGGIPEMVSEGGNGALAAPSDPPSLASALRRALERTWNPADVAASVTEHTWSRAAERYMEIFQRVASPSRPHMAGSVA